jgi:hypothetical protein
MASDRTSGHADSVGKTSCASERLKTLTEASLSIVPSRNRTRTSRPMLLSSTSSRPTAGSKISTEAMGCVGRSTAVSKPMRASWASSCRVNRSWKTTSSVGSRRGCTGASRHTRVWVAPNRVRFDRRSGGEATRQAATEPDVVLVPFQLSAAEPIDHALAVGVGLHTPQTPRWTGSGP